MFSLSFSAAAALSKCLFSFILLFSFLPSVFSADENAAETKDSSSTEIMQEQGHILPIAGPVHEVAISDIHAETS